MGKLLSWVVIGLLAWLAWNLFVVSKRKAERAARERDEARARGGDAQRRGAGPDSGRGGDSAGGKSGGSAGTPGAPAVAGERMVACARCSVYLPESEALLAGGRPYCCAQHRDAGPAAS